MMIRYNAAHRGAETDIFEPLGDACPAIIDYTATRWGRLLLPVPEAGFDAGLSAAECYRFGLSHPAVDTVLCAARSAEEMREDVRGVRARGRSTRTACARCAPSATPCTPRRGAGSAGCSGRSRRAPSGGSARMPKTSTG